MTRIKVNTRIKLQGKTMKKLIAVTALLLFVALPVKGEITDDSFTMSDRDWEYARESCLIVQSSGEFYNSAIDRQVNYLIVKNYNNAIADGYNNEESEQIVIEKVRQALKYWRDTQFTCSRYP